MGEAKRQAIFARVRGLLASSSQRTADLVICDVATIHQLAHAQADAFARWCQSKQAKRREQYRRRMTGESRNLRDSEPLMPWLAAVERDEDPVERELLEEQPA